MEELEDEVIKYDYQTRIIQLSQKVTHPDVQKLNQTLRYFLLEIIG